MNKSSKKILNSVLFAAMGVSIVSCNVFGYENLTLDKINALGLSPAQKKVLSTSTVNVANKQKAVVQTTKPSIRTAVNSTVSEGIKLQGQILVNKGEQRITLSLRDSDVKQVLRMMADKAGLNIIFDTSVTGTVTMDLVDVPLNKAFEYVMTVNGLNYSIDHNTMIVASVEAAAKIGIDKQEMIPIKVKYLDAANVATFLNKNIFSLKKPGLSGEEIAITNPITNEVLLFGTDNDLKLAKKIITQLDTKPESRTYKVNHVTPSKMAQLLCDTVFAQGGASSSAASSSSSSGDGISMGGGNIICKASNSVTASSLESLKANSYSIIEFPNLGTLSIVGATPEQFNLAEEFIKTNDIKTPQVYLEMSIVELSEDGSKQLNNTWSNGGGLWSYAITDAAKGATFTLNNKWGRNHDDKTLHTGSISETITYIIKNTKSRVLANPKIIASNNKKTTINITDDYLKNTEVTFQTTSAGVLTSTEYTIGDDQGIQIDVTPYISPDGYVTMNVKPSYKSLGSQLKATAVDTSGKTEEYVAGTLLHNRDLDLQNIRVKDGNTLIIGGLTQETESSSVSKMPILGDIPVIGSLFRSSSKGRVKTELVILITPKIVKDDEDMNADAKKNTTPAI